MILTRFTVAILSAGLGLGCSFHFENPVEKLTAGEVRGRAVVEREGQQGAFDPAAGSKVRVRGTVFTIATRSSGFFTFVDLPLGPATLVFSQAVPIERTVLRDLDVQATNSGQPDGIILGDVPLLYTAAVEGVLVDAQNRPLPYATAVDDTSLLSVSADDAGHFNFPALAVGKHSLRGWSQPPDGGALLTGGTLEVDLAVADQRGKKTAGTLQLRDATCCGRVKLKVGFIGTTPRPAISRLNIELRRRDNTVLQLTADSEGRVDDSSVPEGVYQVTAADPSGASGYLPAQLPNLVVVKGAPADLGAMLLTSLESVRRAQSSCGTTADCSAGDECADGQCRGANGGPASDVSGTLVNQHLLLDGGLVGQPVDLSAAIVSASVPLEDGGFAVVDGVGTGAGTFTLAAVPLGPYYLRVGNQVVYTQQRTIELGDRMLGRPDVRPAAAGTELSVTAANLASWQAEDDLQVASWNASIGFFSTAASYGPFTSNPPDAGAVELAAAGIDFGGGFGFNLIEGSKGDDLTVFQLASRTTDAGLLIQEATRGFSTSAVTMTQAVSTPVTGLFVTLPPTSTSFDVRHAEFGALRAAVHPLAVSFEGSLWLDVQPGPLTRPLAAGTPDLVVVRIPPSSGDFVLPVRFGNPFPATWTPFVGAAGQFTNSYSIGLPDGGATNPRTESSSVRTYAPLSPSDAGVLRPVIAPVGRLTIDGQSATGSPLVNVSLIPTVSWTAPALGTATHFVVRVSTLTRSLVSNATRTTFVGTILLPGDARSLRIPPGVLKAGTDYFLRVQAFAETEPFDPRQPNRQGAHLGSAEALTSAFKTR